MATTSAEYKTATTAENADVTSSMLMAAARHLGERCALQNEAYMRCKQSADGSSEKCLEEGVAVTNCALNFFKVLGQKCGDQYAAQWKCLDSKNQLFDRCRETQSAMDECVFAKMGIDGAFKTYDTTRSNSAYSKK